MFLLAPTYHGIVVASFRTASRTCGMFFLEIWFEWCGICKQQTKCQETAMLLTVLFRPHLGYIRIITYWPPGAVHREFVDI